MRGIAAIVCVALAIGCAPVAGAEGAACGSCGACVRHACATERGVSGACAVGNDALRKFGRGCANVFSFPIEIYNQMSKAHEEGGPSAAFTRGLAMGTGMMGVRVLVGVYEIVTFPFPVPAGYRPILTDPEFFFKDGSF